MFLILALVTLMLEQAVTFHPVILPTVGVRAKEIAKWMR
jgi:hypothetical protein